MGSSGSGKFGTYRVENNKESDGIVPGTAGDSQDGVGGKSSEIDCPLNIESIRLEDVATSEYYVNNRILPSAGEPVVLSSTIYKGRLVVKITTSGEIIGNLPTQYNYLKNCIDRGMNYTGRVLSSGTNPVPFIVVTLNA
jgi:hypothetical protein